MSLQNSNPHHSVDRRALLGTALGLAGCAGASCGCSAMAATTSAPGAAGAAGYSLRDLGGGLYWVTDGAYSTMFAVSSDGVIACDAPPTLGARYLAAIREVTDKPIVYLVYSHEHVDHIAAAHLFPASTKVIANRRTADLIATRRDPRRRTPDIVYEERHTVTLGDQKLELSWRGINHSFDNTFIFAERQRVLMFIDVVYPGWMPYKNLGVAVDVPGFVDSHHTALSFPFETLVAGHVSRPGTRQDVTVQLEFLRDLASACENAYDSLSFPAFLAAHPGAESAWARHNDYEHALVEKVASAIAPRWRDRLQGFDVYFKDNCWAMLETFVVQGKPTF